MPIVIKCHSCGFIFYQGNQLKSIDDVLKQWGNRCPVCLSLLETKPIRFKIESIEFESLDEDNQVASS